MADVIISREHARAQGLKRYYTGAACKYGHTAERFVTSAFCVDCARLRDHACADEKREMRKVRAVRARTALQEKLSWPIITREEAKVQGLTRYFTGKPCKHGHIAERRASGWVCLECAKVLRVAYRAAKPNIERAKTARYRASHRDELGAKEKARYTARIEEIRAKRNARRAASPDRYLKQERSYREKFPEKSREKARQYRLAYPERVAAWSRNRKARKKLAEGFHTAEDIQRIYQEQSGKCAYCKVKVGKKFHVDHIVSLAKGGSNWPANLQIACAVCNSRKQARDPLEYARSLGLLL